MEFLAGSLVMAVALLSFYWLIQNKLDKSIKVPRHSQARAFALSYEKLDLERKDELPPLKETQASNYLEKSQIKVVIHDNAAYWMQDQRFLTANVINGSVDATTTKPVDTMSMDSVELSKISFIVEKLTERQKNDRRDSGNQKF